MQTRKAEDQDDKTKALLCNTIITSHIMRDNLELLKDLGINTGKLRIARNAFHTQLSQFLNSAYSKSKGKNINWLSDDIDTSIDIQKIVFRMNLEQKQKAEIALKKILANETD